MAYASLDTTGSSVGEAFISYLITTTVFFQPLKYKECSSQCQAEKRKRKKEMLWPVSWGVGVSVSRLSLFIFEGKSFPKDSI